MIAGVCGGLAEYFEIDPTWVRLGFVALALFGGWVIVLLYIVGAIIIPRQSPFKNQGQEPEQGGRHSKATYIAGILLLVLGLFLVFSFFGILTWKLRPFWGIPWMLMWGLFLLTIGVMLFISHQKQNEENSSSSTYRKQKRLNRVRQGRIIGGVCGGLARYFDIDPSFVRLAWTLGTIASVGVGLLTYLVMLIFVPEEPPSDNSAGS
jgi:phage shock protein C